MSDTAPGTGFLGKYRLLLLGGAALGIVLLSSLVVLRPHATCDGIFEQTAPHLEANLEIIRSKGALAVGQDKIQELTESAQKVGLHLKTCCAVLSGGKLNPAQFQQCIDGAAGYDRKVAQVAAQVAAITPSGGSDATAMAPSQRTEIATTIRAASQDAEALGRQVQQLNPAGGSAAGTAATAAAADQEVEPNDTPAIANPIPPGTTVTGEIKAAGDLDYYKITASKNQRDLLRVSLENLSTTLAPNFTLYNQNKSQIGYDHYDGTAGADLKFAFVLEPGGSNYLRVSGVSSTLGAYRLKFVYQNAADQYEPNDNAAQASALRSGQTLSASIMDGQDQDWYRFQAGAHSALLRMDTDSQTLAPQLMVYDENRAQIANPYSDTHGAALDYTLTTVPGKTYYIAVIPYGDTSVPGNYRLRVTDSAAPAQ